MVRPRSFVHGPYRKNGGYISSSLDAVQASLPRPSSFYRDTCQNRALWPEKLLAIQTYYRIRMRDSKCGLFFVDRRQLERMVGRDPDSEIPIASVFPLDADIHASSRS